MTPETKVLTGRAIFFDVGETLVDETTEYHTWADWLGVPRHTFSTVFGAVIARGQDYREVFQHFRPGFDLELERKRRAEAGKPETFTEADLYPDVRRCLQTLKDRGWFVGIAGNQTARAEQLLRDLNLPSDAIGTSASWQAEKPSPAFFTKMIEITNLDPHEIIYVGDRLENDILPAAELGLQTVLLRRGPWGHVNDAADELARVDLRLDSLSGLVDHVALSP